MKRATALVCILLLVCCLAAPAGADGAEYPLPDSLKSIPGAAADMALPSGLPEPVHITAFSITDGLITVELDQEVPKLKIMELNLLTGEESTIYSRKNTASGETHRTGNDSSVFTVRMIWDPKGMAYTQEYNTWYGILTFSRAGLTETADPEAFPEWASAKRALEFRQDGALLSETWKLERSEDTFTRTTIYDEFGQLESCTISWRSADPNGDILDAGFGPDGSLISLRCRNRQTDFSAESLPIGADISAFVDLRDNSYDPYSFEEKLRQTYPRLAESLYGESFAASYLPATATDLPATATDLTAPAEEPALPDEEPVEEGETTENTRVWMISYGDWFESRIYAFASDDPIFIMRDGKAMPNTAAKDINGTPVTWSEAGAAVSPTFEAPAVE